MTLSDTDTDTDTDTNPNTKTTSTIELFKQGAEGKIYRHEYLGYKVITKQRFCKRYRHPYLDTKLTQSRFTQEIRLLIKARQIGVLTPHVLFVDQSTFSFILEWIDGEPYRSYLETKNSLISTKITTKLNSSFEFDVNSFLNQEGSKLGQSIALLHQHDIIHGDLTTSNILTYRDQVYLIDFGLAYMSTLMEDKAVDLYVLERAIQSTHPSIATQFITSILNAYKESWSQGRLILNKLDEVRLRGRKRSMVG